MSTEKSTLLSSLVQRDPSYPADTHQAILNICWKLWTSEVRRYSQFIEKVDESYGDLAVLAILLGKYHQQVCNGGHAQYCDNDYAGDDFYRTGDLSLHEEMLLLMREFGLHETESGKVVVGFAGRLMVADEDWDEDEKSWTAELSFQTINGDELDEEYYKICDAWEAWLKNYFYSMLVPISEMLEWAKSESQ